MIDLKAWRNGASITQAQAADRLGITERHYRRIETGKAPINRRLAIILQVDMRANQYV